MAIVATLAISSAVAQSEATYNYIDKNYTLNADGSIELNVRSSLTLHTHTSFNSLFGETFIEYNPDFESIVVNDSRTIQQDGTVITTPTNAFNEVLPKSAADAPDYNTLKELVITHTGTEIGATLLLDYTIRTSAEKLGGNIDVYEKLPVYGADVRRYTISITTPSDKPLHWEVVDSSVKPVVSGGKYTWKFTNIPEFTAERLAATYNGRPRLYATTMASPLEVVARITADTRDMVRVPRSVVKDATNDEQIISAIASYVGGNVALCPVAPRLTGYRHSAASDTDSRGYGSVLDKAALLYKLLASEGYEAELVLMYPGDCSIRTLGGYVEPLVRVETSNGAELFYDVNGKKATPSLNCDRYEYLGCSTAKPLDITPSVRTVRHNVETAILDGRLSGTFVTITDGDEFSGKLGSTKTDASPEVKAFTFTKPRSGVSYWTMPAMNASRRETLELPYQIDQTENYSLNSGEHKILTRPSVKTINNSVGSLEISVKTDGNTVTVTRHILIKKAIVAPSQWQQARTLLSEWIDGKQLTVLYK